MEQIIPEEKGFIMNKRWLWLTPGWSTEHGTTRLPRGISRAFNIPPPELQAINIREENFTKFVRIPVVQVCFHKCSTYYYSTTIGTVFL